MRAENHMSSAPDFVTTQVKARPAYDKVVALPSSPPGKSFGGVIAFLVYVLCGAAAIYLDAAPAAAPAAGNQGFSIERALGHVQEISRLPHPIGSVEHERVKNYILRTLQKTGLAPEIQETVATNEKAGQGATVENIVARLKGTGNGKAVMLAAHYDSVFTGPGAADDGAAVATLLETARVLHSRPPLKRDVIFLFTDGEEVGLLGARAFVKENPLAREVGATLNFEARGTRGPVIMFETSRQNGWLIDQFARAAPRPVANSLAYEIYKTLPNDTDFSIFKKAGYSGLNFAFIDGMAGYHNDLDNFQDLDKASLQHSGSYAVALATALANATGEDLKRSDEIYFDVLGLALVHYSKWAGVSLAVLVAILVASVMRFAIARKAARGKSLVKAMAVTVAAIVTAGATAIISSWAVGTLAGVSDKVRAGLLYHPGLFVVAFAAFGIAASSAAFVGMRNRISSQTAAFAALLVWLILLAVATVFLPGASFVLLWPLLLMAAAWLATFVIGRGPKFSRSVSVVSVLAAIPAVFLLVSLAHKVFTAFGKNSAVPVALLLALLFTLVLWQLSPDKLPHPWLLPGVLFAAGVIFLAGALAMSRFDKDHPRFDSLFYAANADTDTQVWASHDDRPDSWTAQFFTGAVRKQPMPNFFPGSDQRFLQAAAPQLPFAPPSLEVTDDETSAGQRRLRVRIKSGRGAPMFSVLIQSQAAPSNVLVNGKALDLLPLQPGTWLLQYYGAEKDGIEAAFSLPAAVPVQVKVEDISSDLLEQAAHRLPPRPQGIIPAPNRFNNTIVIMKSFNL
jgi:hypothetical protein